MLTILSGLPGSGLTTKAKELMKENSMLVRISRYELEQSLFQGINGHISDKYLNKVLETLVLELSLEGLDVVIDDSNLDPKIMGQYKTLARY